MTIFHNITVEGKSNPRDLDQELCLVADEFMDYNHKDVNAQAQILTSGLEDLWDRIAAIYVFVRDEIVYDFAPQIESLNDWKASTILKNKRGYCHQKSILQSALFRALGFPSALVFQEIIDYPLLKTRYKDRIPNGILPYHALAAVFIDDKWYRLDATLDSGLCTRRGYQVTTVNPGCETLLPETTQNGHPHFKIQCENGFLEAYPHIFCDAFLKNLGAWEEWRSFVKQEYLSM